MARDNFGLQLSSPVDFMGLNKSKYWGNSYKICLGRRSWNNKGSDSALLMQMCGFCTVCLLYITTLFFSRAHEPGLQLLPSGCVLPGFTEKTVIIWEVLQNLSSSWKQQDQEARELCRARPLQWPFQMFGSWKILGSSSCRRGWSFKNRCGAPERSP